MPEKTAVNLGNVQITLLLPLWGRAVETKKKNPVLTDFKALEIINNIDYDFTKISEIIHPVTQFEWIARSMHIDRSIKEFLLKYPRATIVNVGCGLDTTYERVDNGKLLWYDLDLPDVIDLRKKFIKEGERRKNISCSLLDEKWFKEVDVEENVLFFAAGVMYYLEESQVKEIFTKISLSFPNSEFVFDAASPLGVKEANKRVIENSGLDEKSHLKWGLAAASDILKWNDRITLIKEYPIYKKMTKSLGLKNRFIAYLSDRYRIMYMVHLRL